MGLLDGDPILRDIPAIEGFKVLGRSVLYARIGQGGMGAVYRAAHSDFEIEVGVKCLLPSLAAEDPGFVERFRREAKLAAQVTHQNIVRVYEIGEESGVHYLVMEFVRGETARERVVRKSGGQAKGLAVGEAVTIIWQAALGVAEAHRKGIVHRDLKPDNILISADGEVKVTDLGLARAREGSAREGRTMSGLAFGTPRYMPPEQWDGIANVGPPGDVWALGATLYYLIAGLNAYEDETHARVMKRIITEEFPDIREKVPGIPDALVEILAKATAREASDRYANAAELAAALEELIRNENLRGSLADEKAGTTPSRSAMISPPPPEILVKVRKRRSEPTLTMAVGPDAALGGAVGIGFGTTARGGKTRRASWLADPRGRLAVGAVALLTIALLVFFLWPGGEGKKDDDGPKINIAETPAERVAALVAQAKRELLKVETFDDGVGHLEEAYELDTTNAETRLVLVASLERQVRTALDAKRLGQAFRQVRRLLGLAPNPSSDKLRAEIIASIEKEIEGGFAIEEPAAGARIGSKTVDLRGTLGYGSDYDKVEVKVAGEEAPLLTGKFKHTLSNLDEGEREIPIDVLVEGEVKVALKHSFVVDLTPPRVEIVEPAPGIDLPWGELAASGNASDAGPATIELHWQAPDGARVEGAAIVAQVENDVWRANLLPPRGGDWVLVAEAVDAAGNRSAPVTRPLRIDADPPVIAVTEPIAGSEVPHGRLVVRGTLEDRSSVTVTVDGVPATVESAEFRAEIDTGPAGEHTITVEAKDAAGNEAAPISHSIIVDTTPPELAVETPVNGSEVGYGKIPIAGTVSDASRVEVIVDGVQAALIANGSAFRQEIDRNELGPTRVTISAKDSAGNSAEPIEIELTVVDGTPPVVTITEPSGPTELPRGSIVVRGKVEDRSTVRVRVAGEDAIVNEDGSWEAAVPVAELGARTLAVEATDLLGNTSSAATPEIRVWREIPGFERRGKNKQGFDEYAHRATGIPFVFVPGGEFAMGTPENEADREKDETLHLVKLDPFLIAKHELTYAEWEKIMSRESYGAFTRTGKPGDPVENIPLALFEEFASKAGLKFPTEAQWEYACRGRTDYKAGTLDPFSFGMSITKEQVNFQGRAVVRAESLPPNGFGIHEMHGNVWEWCLDIYDPEFYTKPDAKGPNPISTSGPKAARVLRGGGYFSRPKLCRSGNRDSASPGPAGKVEVGFRPAFWPLSD